MVTEKVENPLLEDYFAQDEDDGEHNVVFRDDDADDMLEYFNEISEFLSSALSEQDQSKVKQAADIFSKIGSILLHYSPYIDTLASSMEQLAQSMRTYTDEFMDILGSSNGELLKLFDAVNLDMDRYIQRFSIESLAMKNAHHIHEPTTLSIVQIISMFAPTQFEENEIDFF